jgi:hypothetical protein
MLSPHEFATLMLIRQAPGQLDMNRAELDALLERQLVMLEHRTGGRRRAHLTDKGRSFLYVLHPQSAPRTDRTHVVSPGEGDSLPSPGGRTAIIEVPESAG